MSQKLKEDEVAPQVVQAMEASGAHLFRNNVGCAKFGRRWVRYGVGGNGGSDWIGFVPIRVTPEMVGHVVAVFTACETKAEVRGVHSQKQKDFIANALAFGAIAGFAKHWSEGIGLIARWRARFPKADCAKTADVINLSPEKQSTHDGACP